MVTVQWSLSLMVTVQWSLSLMVTVQWSLSLMVTVQWSLSLMVTVQWSLSLIQWSLPLMVASTEPDIILSTKPSPAIRTCTANMVEKGPAATLKAATRHS